MIMQLDWLFKNHSNVLVAAIKNYVEFYIDWIEDVGGLEKAIQAYSDPVLGYVEWMADDDKFTAAEQFELRSAAGLVGDDEESRMEYALSQALGGVRLDL